MKSHLSIPVPTTQFVELVEFLSSKGDPSDPVEVVSKAINYWMDNASWKAELLTVCSARGYQWKNLFLPESTEIRMQYKGAYSYAKVEGDDIIFKGKPISPSAMANTVAGGSRNAWRDIWIKRPADREWRLADDCRSETAESDRLHDELGRS
jgi:hypothetical protein